jgi:hypothetical protein
MRRTICGLAVILAIAIASAGVCATAGKAQTPAKGPAGEGVIAHPEKHFKLAYEHFVRKQQKAAALEIRKAAALLKQESSRAVGAGKKALTASARQLESLANGVEKGAVTSGKELKQAFARADHALAVHYNLKAKEEQAKKETKKAGYHLKAAAADLEHGAAWAGHKIEAGGVAAVRTARLVAGKLIQGTGWVPAEVGKAIQGIGREIEKLGKKVETAGKS